MNLGYFNCTHNFNMLCSEVEFNLVLSIGLASDFAAMLGAGIIMIIFFAFKELRTRARQILLMISIADFFDAMFFAVAQIYSLFRHQYAVCYPGKPTIENWVCIIQAALNNFFLLSSINCTIFLAFYIACVFYRVNIVNRKYAFSIIAFICWGIPFAIVLTAFLFNRYGPEDDVITAGWCFIGHDTDFKLDISTEFFLGKGFDIVTIISISILYFLISVKFFKVYRKNQQSSYLATLGSKDLKPIAIPLVFLIIRLPGLIRYFTLFWYLREPRQCSFVLKFIQALFQPAQGWANAMLYIVFTRVVRNKVIRTLYVFKRRMSRTNSTKINYDSISSCAVYNTGSNSVSFEASNNSEYSRLID